MEQLIWTAEKLAPFLKHSDSWVRQWAVERLIKLFPNQAGDLLDVVLDDDYSFIVLKATEFYGEKGDAKYSPILLENLERSRGERFGYLAQALAELGEREALPLLLERVQQAISGERQLEQSEFLRVVSALGQFGGDEARQLLWNLLDIVPGNDFAVQALMGALLRCARPEHVKELVKRYRSLPWGNKSDRLLKGFAAVLGESRLAEEVIIRSGDLDDAIDEAESWLGCPPNISEECHKSLEDAFGSGYEGVFQVLLREAQRLIAERGDDISAWRADWEQERLPEGYPRFALYVPVLLEAFAEFPSEDPEQRQDESSLGIALLCALAVHKNDEQALESAPDRAEALLTILSDCREHVLPDIVDRVVALGPEVVPRLVDLLVHRELEWGLVRVVMAIGRMARAYPGSCDAAVPRLIDLVNEEGGDYLLEACAETLSAIGPPAVDEVAQHLRDPDISRQIYLTGVLGDIPTESSADAVLSFMSDSEEPEETHYIALMEIGSASAIEPLYQEWLAMADFEIRGADYQLIETLLILCQVHGVEKPEMAEWRRLLREQQKRLDELSSALLEEPKELEPSLNGIPFLPPKKRSVRSAKKVSKQEKKKRASNRKANKKKKR